MTNKKRASLLHEGMELIRVNAASAGDTLSYFEATTLILDIIGTLHKHAELHEKAELVKSHFSKKRTKAQKKIAFN